LKIMVVLPGKMPEDEIEHRRNYLQRLVSFGTEVEVVGLDFGPTVIEELHDVYLLIPGILRRVKEANDRGFDAVAIHCFADPGLEASKSISRIPVLGGCKTSLHIASLLAEKIAIITFTDKLIPYIWKLAKLYGIYEAVISIRALNIPILELRDRKDEVKAKFAELAKLAKGEGADIIVPGCLAILPAMGPESTKELEEEASIQILDPSKVLMKTAEMVCSLTSIH